MCTRSCCEIICRNTRESSPVPSSDNRRGMSPTAPSAVACRKTTLPSAVGGFAPGPQKPHAEAPASPPSAAPPASKGVGLSPCKC
eukprot:4366520-Pleurochrysis_carterae.AAC.1